MTKKCILQRVFAFILFLEFANKVGQKISYSTTSFKLYILHYAKENGNITQNIWIVQMIIFADDKQIKLIMWLKMTNGFLSYVKLPFGKSNTHRDFSW